MKKVFLTLALAAFAFAANAQFVVSGSLNFNHNGIKNTLDGDEYWTGAPNKSTGFGIDLKGGYQINDQWQVGVMLGFDMGTTVIEDDLTGAGSVNYTETDKTHMFGFGVYGRYDFLQFKKLNVFAEAQLAMGIGGGKNEIETAGTTVSTDHPKDFALTIAVVPGVSYKLTDNLSADLYLNFIGLGFSMAKQTTKTTNASGSEIDDVNTISSFGLNATCYQDDINTLFNNVSLGFTYRF